jgi:ABC-type uncharacterized transport system auxiliary subunit
MIGKLGCLAGLLIAAAVLAGCTGGTPSAAPTSSSRATYPLGPRTVRPDEVPLRLPPAQEGDTMYTLIGFTASMPSLVGSHAEFNAKGVFTRVRLVVENVGRSGVPFNTRAQLMVLGNGTTVAPDEQAMLIKRQPGEFDLGAGVRVEFDLYYDIPKDSKPTALRVFGGPTLADPKDQEGRDIPLS